MGGKDWPLVPLGELTDNFDGRRVPVKEIDRKPGPYPYYGASGIVDRVDGYLFDGEYLLIGEDGENLRTRQTPIAFIATGKFWVNNHAHIVRGNHRADTRFLSYVFSQTDISGYLTGSTMPKLTQGNLNRLPVIAPPLPEQRAIASVLGALDDKIELNRRMNATLEAMARALFQSWFVDFDPVRAKLDGRHPAALDPAPAALFPEHLEESPIGKKPVGWEITTLETALSVLEVGGRPKGGVGGITSGIPSIGAESIVGVGQFDFGKTKYVPVEFYEGMKKGHIQSHDVLLYKDGGRPGEYEPHVSMFGDGFPFEKCSINEHVYRLRANERLSQEYLYFWLTSELALSEMRVKGTGVAIPGLNSTAVRSLTTLVPPKPIIEAFTKQAAPLVTRILANSKQSRTLATLRDTLLPKLLSGELSVANFSAMQDISTSTPHV